MWLLPPHIWSLRQVVSYPMNKQQTYKKIVYVKVDRLDQILARSIKKWPDVCVSIT